jgi:hypothetical protein
MGGDARQGGFMDLREIETRFTYHKPRGDQPERYVALRDKAKELASMIDELTPESREQSIAFTKLEEAVMWANAAIARREYAPPGQKDSDKV